MSVADKITRLQTAKSNIASAITTKGGTVSSGDGFEDFATDIATIPTGSENVLLYATNALRLFANATGMPNQFHVTFGDAITVMSNSYNGTFQATYTVSHDETSKLKITAGNNVTNLSYLCNNWGYWDDDQLTRKAAWCNVELDFSTSKVTNFSSMCTNSQCITTFTNPLDFSAATNVGTTSTSGLFYGCGTSRSSPGLTNLRIVPNTIKIDFPLNACNNLSDASVISVANGLNESVTGKTLTLHATPKAKCTTIVGTVTMDSTSTYHVFTEDSSGSTTLEDFIVNTKGWTLA